MGKCWDNPNVRERMKKFNPVFKEEVRLKISETLKRKYREGIIKSTIGRYNEGNKEKIAERMRRNNPMFNDLLIQKMLNTKKIRGNLATKKKFTNIEKIIEKILSRNRIIYIPHTIIGRYEVDFFIPCVNLFIECDGEHWHNYPYHTTRDIQKDYFLMDKGLFGLRFWEREINNQEDMCESTILKLIENIKQGDCICP